MSAARRGRELSETARVYQAVGGAGHLSRGTAPMGDRSADYALVQRVQQGDKRAFDVLVLKYQHKLIKLISRYVRDTSEVQDVAQEAFI